MKNRHAGLVPVAVTLALAPVLCEAEPGNPLTDRVSVSLGTFFLNTSTTVRVDGEGTRGTDIDLERELGLGDTDRFRADAYWRFFPRHKLRVLYFDNSQSDTVTLDQDIEFRGTLYPVNVELSSRFDTTVAELAYEYSFFYRDRWELAASVGVHNLEFELDLSASAGPQTGTISNSARANGPMPVVGLRGVWRITDWLYADAQAQYFQISIDPYDGSLEDYTASLVWRPLKHFALGAGWNEFVTRLDVDGSRFDGRLRWEYGGARVFVTFAF